MTTEDQAKLKRLLTEACDLSFDCGEWNGVDLSVYKKLRDQSKSAKQAVLDFVEELTERAYSGGQEPTKQKD